MTDTARTASLGTISAARSPACPPGTGRARRRPAAADPHLPEEKAAAARWRRPGARRPDQRLTGHLGPGWHGGPRYDGPRMASRCPEDGPLHTMPRNRPRVHCRRYGSFWRGSRSVGWASGDAHTWEFGVAGWRSRCPRAFQAGNVPPAAAWAMAGQPGGGSNGRATAAEQGKLATGQHGRHG